MDYRKLRASVSDSCQERPHSYQMFTERHLQAIWCEQRYFRTLVTDSGAPVSVISPGIWNAEAGPDFLKAHLRIGDQEVRGDIELHLSDEGWMQHGHQTDKRYNGVVLHVALWKPQRPHSLMRLDGAAIPCVYLEDALTVPLARLVQLIDLDLYPYRKFIGSGKCAHSLFRTLSESDTEQLFASAAMWRIEEKGRYLRTRIADRKLRLPAGIAMALGYKANAPAFLELFLWLLEHKHRGVDELLTLALGAAGFFAVPYLERWRDSDYYQSLLRHWSVLQPLATQHYDIVVLHQRPLNHPVRRLACLVHLVRDDSWSSLLTAFESTWRQGWGVHHQQGKWKTLFTRFMEFIPTYSDPYWASHFTFETTAKANALPLMGSDLKRSIIVNTLLPLLYEDVNPAVSPEEVRAFMAFFDSLSAPDTGKRRYLTHRFFGDSPKGKLLAGAVGEQGAFQIHRDFCVHFEASCEGCPFVERVKDQICTR